jgi:2-iminobutanoate/2-iminopropanoate deaminase
MTRRAIKTPNAPTPAGHYSQGIVAGNEIYVCGSGPFDPHTHAVVQGGIAEQTRRTLDNIKAIVEAAGGRMENLAKVTVYLKDMAQFKEFDDAYKAYFPADPPVRTTVQAALWGEGRLIVIDAIGRLD